IFSLVWSCCSLVVHFVVLLLFSHALPQIFCAVINTAENLALYLKIASIFSPQDTKLADTGYCREF
ncbi:MAG: hypothetical protein CVU35_09530, partial [Betaproteobacteria bacterium HGW-Betaproteobacteria-8]